MSANKLVEPHWLEEHLDDPKIRILEFNWNATDAYDSWHIPGAQGWYWKEWLWDELVRDFPSPDTFAKRCAASGITNDSTIICYGEPPQFGTYGWWVITYMGHPDVRVLNGGRVRWENEKRPTTNKIPEITPTNYLPNTRINHSMRARRDEILDKLDKIANEHTVLLDHRSPEEYKGERVNMLGVPDVGAERAGRIPGAKHLYYADLLTNDTSFKTSKELRQLFEERGATIEKDIISYCRLSHRATLAYFAMTEILGYEQVKSYDGSWTEWGSIVGVPIEK
ncbi:MAG: sulfurtransferase [Rhodospirillales bacterium]|nr:sulfurtransferase [Rhodospirillales bacterium]